VYMCPHAPQERCSCRKPQPGLILRAAEDLNIDLARSILIGDAVSDIQAAASAGVGQSILVQTGRGKKQRRLIPEDFTGNYCIEDSLNTAIRKIVSWNQINTADDDRAGKTPGAVFFISLDNELKRRYTITRNWITQKG